VQYIKEKRVGLKFHPHNCWYWPDSR